MMVLHDLPNVAMRHLDRVLGTWQDQGVTFLATPPESCLPIGTDGRPRGSRILSHPTHLTDNSHRSAPRRRARTRGRDRSVDPVADRRWCTGPGASQ